MAKNPQFNPLSSTAKKRSAAEILQASFNIGIGEHDRGYDVWDEERVVDGEVVPGWVHIEDQNRECLISYTTNEGKGTGRQIIPATEFRDYVAELQKIHDSGYKEPERAERTSYIPTNVIARESFRMVQPKVQVTDDDGKTRSVLNKNADKDQVSIRSSGGKGAKPMIVPKNEFPGVLALLHTIEDNLETYVENAWQMFRDAGGEDDEDDSSAE